MQTGLLTAHPAHRPPTCSPAGYWFKRPHPAVGGVRSFLKEQQTPARKHRPDFSGSWLLHYSAGSSHIPLSKGLAACRWAVLDRTSSCTRLPHPAFFLTLAEAGSSLVLPKSLAVHRCPRGFGCPSGLARGCGLTACSSPSSISQHMQKILGRVFLGMFCSPKPTRAVLVRYPCWEEDGVGQEEAAPHPLHPPKPSSASPKGNWGFSAWGCPSAQGPGECWEGARWDGGNRVGFESRESKALFLG